MTPNCKETCCGVVEGSSSALFDEKWCGDDVEVFEVEGFEFEDRLVVMTFLRPPRSSRMSSSSGL